MFNINTANNAPTNLTFTKRPRKVLVKVGNDFEPGQEILTRQSCNNCKVKAQRMPRFHRQHGHRLAFMVELLQENKIGTVMCARDYSQRGMLDEAHDVEEFDGINLRYIQAQRRRERDQAQSWKRKGQLIEKQIRHVVRYGLNILDAHHFDNGN